MRNCKCLKLLLIALTLMAAKCKKEEALPQDPFATLSNQLICKIDGKEWKSNEIFGGFFLISGTGDQYIYLRFKNSRESINFYLNPPYNRGYYLFNKVTISYPTNVYPEDYASFIRGYPDLTPEEEYITNSNDTGRLDFVLLDTLNKTIKARFFFSGRDQRTTKSVSVTDGYFEYHQ